MVAVTSHWTDGTRHVPLGVKAYRPASRLPKGRADPAFRTKPALAWELIEQARAAGIPFRLVVADAIYGENATLEGQLFTAQIPYVMGLRPSHGPWQVVEDAAHPPAFTPAEAAQRLPKGAWQRTVRFDTHGKQLVRYLAELEVGPSYGPDRGVRLLVATMDPVKLKPESTWYLATSLPLPEVSAEQVYEIYRLRDWIEHFYKPVKHDLGWADDQMRPERAIVRHWQLVLLAFTFSLLVGALPSGDPRPANAATPPSPSRRARERVGWGEIRASGERRGTHRVERGAATAAGVALPVGSAAAVLETLVVRRPTARAGRAPRPRRPVAPA